MTDTPFDTDALATNPPEVIVAGLWTSWKQETTYSDALYRLEYRIGAATIAGTYDTADAAWIFTIPSATSAAWSAGDQRWSLVLVRLADDEAVEIATGIWTVFTSASDRRTHAEKMVAKIESILEGRADADVASYSIKGRSLTKLSPSELTKWRDYYKAEIIATGGSTTASGPPRNVLRVRFV